MAGGRARHESVIRRGGRSDKIDGDTEVHDEGNALLHRKIYTVAAVAALALTQQACAGSTSEEPGGAAAPTTTTTTTAATAPSSSAAPTQAATSTTSTTPAATKAPAGKATKGSGAILAGKRQVVIKPVQSAESIVALDKGRLTTIDGEAEHTLFVLSPTSGKFLIKTAKVVSGGEPLCLVVKTNGTGSLTVASAACDAGKSDQLFTIEAAGKAWSIANGDAFLQLSPKYGIIARELGDAPLTTTFTFVDNGASTLPKLGD